MLIDEFPMYLQNVVELREITGAEDEAFEQAEESLNSVSANQYLFDSDDYGVSRREKMYGLTKNDTDTLEERKFRIYSYINQDLPYTIYKLDETMRKLCGEGNYSIEIDYGNREIVVKIGLASKSMQKSVEDVANRMIPCNMIRYIRILYNTFETLESFTHEELEAYTHEQLREEVLE